MKLARYLYAGKEEYGFVVGGSLVSSSSLSIELPESIEGLLSTERLSDSSYV